MENPSAMHPNELRTYFLQVLAAKGMPLKDINEGCNLSKSGYEQYQFECKIDHFPFDFRYRQRTDYDLQFRMKEYWGTDNLLESDVLLPTQADAYAYITKLVGDVQEMIRLIERQRLLRVGWNQVGLANKMPDALVRKFTIDAYLEENPLI